MARRARPTRIFREEVTYPTPDRRFNSTRQTFDEKQFLAWQRLSRTSQVEVRFFVGEINWKEV